MFDRSRAEVKRFFHLERRWLDIARLVGNPSFAFYAGPRLYAKPRIWKSKGRIRRHPGGTTPIGLHCGTYRELM
jgi:hypothetical protein